MSRLKIRRHEQNYSELTLVAGRTYFLGRKEDSDVVLQPDPGISRQHIKIEFADGFWTIQVLSQHIPITFDGKSLPVLVCKSPVTNFYVAPYSFELKSDVQNADEAPPTVEDIDDSIQLKTNAYQGYDKSSAGELPPTFNASEEEPMMAPPFHAPSESSSMGSSSPSPAGSASSSTSSSSSSATSAKNSKPREELSDPAIDPEVSFHGNEEATSDVYQGDEPYLKFMYSTHTESIRLKGNKWIAGRDTIAQIQLDDRKASRQHFSIEKVGLEYFIKDLGSANGTLLNGQELNSTEVREIKSGDIITVNQLTIIFELRDLSFSEKLKDLPLQVYSGPMILTSQEWDIAAPAPSALPTDRLAQLPGTVQRIEEAPKNRMRQILLAVVAVIAIGGGLMYGGEERAPASSQDETVKSFEGLSKEDKKIILDAYNAAQNFYKEGHFQNALNRLAAIHKILPFYKDSLELQTRLVEAQETLRQQEFIAQQRREQEKTRLKVASIIADCRDRYQGSVDVTAARACLSEALQLDPENSDGQSIIAEIEMRLAAAEEAEKRRKELDDNIAKGRELFYKAKNHFGNRAYHDAIAAFSTHLNANLPDPDGLRQKSERGIASIERLINTQKSKYMSQAQTALSANNLRDAIAFAEQARKVDPFDLAIANFIDSTSRDLTDRMKRIFMESGIEERFGNLELCKTKWQEIIAKDSPNGVYYEKAKRKLQQYGY